MRAGWLTLVLIATGTTGCADAVVGEWSFTWTVERASGQCEPELDQVSTGIVTMREQEDGSLSLTPFGDDDAAQVGNLVGKTLTFSGEYPEDNGTTVTSTSMVLSEDENTLSGSEDWSWSNDQGASCPDNESSVEATRVVPK